MSDFFCFSCEGFLGCWNVQAWRRNPCGVVTLHSTNLMVGFECTQIYLVAFFSPQEMEGWCIKCKLWLLLNSLVQLFFYQKSLCSGVCLFAFVLGCYLLKSLGFSGWVLLGILALTQENTVSASSQSLGNYEVSMWRAFRTLLAWAKDRTSPWQSLFCYEKQIQLSLQWDLAGKKCHSSKTGFRWTSAWTAKGFTIHTTPCPPECFPLITWLFCGAV